MTLREAAKWASDHFEFQNADALPESNDTIECALIFTDGKQSGYITISLSARELSACSNDELTRRYLLPMAANMKYKLTKPVTAHAAKAQ